MEEKYINKLYELLERLEEENDMDSIAALRWAIFKIENK
jgi:hypothetical protein